MLLPLFFLKQNMMVSKWPFGFEIRANLKIEEVTGFGFATREYSQVYHII